MSTSIAVLSIGTLFLAFVAGLVAHHWWSSLLNRRTSTDLALDSVLASSRRGYDLLDGLERHRASSPWRRLDPTARTRIAGLIRKGAADSSEGRRAGRRPVRT